MFNSHSLILHLKLKKTKTKHSGWNKYHTYHQAPNNWNSRLNDKPNMGPVILPWLLTSCASHVKSGPWCSFIGFAVSRYMRRYGKWPCCPCFVWLLLFNDWLWTIGATISTSGTTAHAHSRLDFSPQSVMSSS